MPKSVMSMMCLLLKEGTCPDQPTCSRCSSNGCLHGGDALSKRFRVVECNSLANLSTPQARAATGILRKRHLAESLSLCISGRLATALYRNGGILLESCLKSTSRCTASPALDALPDCVVTGSLPPAVQRTRHGASSMSNRGLQHLSRQTTFTLRAHRVKARRS